MINKILIGLILIGLIGGVTYHKITVSNLEDAYEDMSAKSKKIFEDEKLLIIQQFSIEKDTLNQRLLRASNQLNQIESVNNRLTNKIKSYEINPKYLDLDFINAADHMSKYKYRPSE